MADEPQPHRRGSLTQAVVLLVGGLVLYALSPAPVAWLIESANASWAKLIFEGIYYPLYLVAQQLPLVNAFYQAYFALLGLR